MQLYPPTPKQSLLMLITSFKEVYYLCLPQHILNTQHLFFICKHISQCQSVLVWFGHTNRTNSQWRNDFNIAWPMIKYNLPNWRPISGLHSRGERKYWGWSLSSSCGMAYQGEQFKAAIFNYLSSICHWPFSILISLWSLLWLTFFIHSIKSYCSKGLLLSTPHGSLH